MPTTRGDDQIMRGTQIALYLPRSLRAELDAHVEATDRPMARIVRQAIRDYLAREREAAGA